MFSFFLYALIFLHLSLLFFIHDYLRKIYLKDDGKYHFFQISYFLILKSLIEDQEYLIFETLYFYHH